MLTLPPGSSSTREKWLKKLVQSSSDTNVYVLRKTNLTKHNNKLKISYHINPILLNLCQAHQKIPLPDQFNTKIQLKQKILTILLKITPLKFIPKTLHFINNKLDPFLSVEDLVNKITQPFNLSTKESKIKKSLSLN